MQTFLPALLTAFFDADLLTFHDADLFAFGMRIGKERAFDAHAAPITVVCFQFCRAKGRFLQAFDRLTDVSVLEDYGGDLVLDWT